MELNSGDSLGALGLRIDDILQGGVGVSYIIIILGRRFY